MVIHISSFENGLLISLACFYWLVWFLVSLSFILCMFYVLASCQMSDSYYDFNPCTRLLSCRSFLYQAKALWFHEVWFFFLLLALRLKQLEFFFESPCLCLYFEVLPFQWILEFQVSGTFGVDFLQGESGKLDLFFYVWMQPFLSHLVHLKRLTFLQRMWTSYLSCCGSKIPTKAI